MTNRYKLIDSEGYTENIILIDNLEDYPLPDGYSVELDDGVYNKKPLNQTTNILTKIQLLELKVTTRRLLEASLGNEDSINFLAQINTELESLRQQLKTAK
jgi:hypothetical protein